MKKLLLVLALLMSLLLCGCSSKDPGVFRGVDWGMTAKQVEKIEAKNGYIHKSEDASSVTYHMEGEGATSITYTFEGANNGLSKISIHSYNFSTFINSISQQYGEPRTAENVMGMVGLETVEKYYEWRSENCDINAVTDNNIYAPKRYIVFAPGGTLLSSIDLLN